MKKRIRVFSLILAIALAFSCLFTFTETAEAAAVKVSVVDQIRYPSLSDLGDVVVSFKYNTKGLVTEMREYDHGDQQSFYKITYSYGDNNLVKTEKVSQGGGGSVYKLTYSYNTDNQLTKRVRKYSDGETHTEKFTYKNGKVSKVVTTYKGCYDIPDGSTKTVKYSYNDKGVLSRIETSSSYSKEKQSNTIKLNSNGFVTRYNYSDYHMTRKYYTNKDGSLRKYKDYIIDTTTRTDDPRRITTKTVSVAKSRSAIVQKQQEEIINRGYGQDFYLGLPNY